MAPNSTHIRGRKIAVIRLLWVRHALLYYLLEAVLQRLFNLAICAANYVEWLAIVVEHLERVKIRDILCSDIRTQQEKFDAVLPQLLHQ